MGGVQKGLEYAVRKSRFSTHCPRYLGVGMLNTDCWKSDQAVQLENGDENLEQNRIIILYNNGHHSPL